MDKEDQGKKMGQVIAKAWTDDAFKQRLLKDAGAVLKEEGVEVPEDLEVRAVENTDKLFHLVLPPRRTTGELSDEELESVAGGRDKTPPCHRDCPPGAGMPRDSY